MNGTSEVNPQERFDGGRREFLQLAGVGLLSGLLPEKAEAAEIYKVVFKVLDENDKIDIGDSQEEIIKKAYKLGYKYEKDHGGCARCTVAALQDAIEFIPKDKGLFRAAGCLDGGATPTKEANCGGFTGSGMVIGWTCGTETFKGGADLSHKLIRRVHERFKEEYGSVLCKDVRKKIKGDCPEVVGRAARWTAEILLTQFASVEQK